MVNKQVSQADTAPTWWDVSWHYARVGVSGVQTAHAISCALCALAGVNIESQLPIILIAGTFSEVFNRAGTMWLLHPERSLPLWPMLGPLKHISRMMHRSPWINQCLVAAFWASLACSMRYRGAILPAVLCMWALCLLDGWRLLYTHYWLAGLSALLFPDVTRNILMMLGGLYFWSGV